MKRANENGVAGLPIAFADMKMSLSPSVVELDAPLGDRILRVLSCGSSKKMVRSYAGRIIAMVAGVLPLLQRLARMVQVKTESTRGHILAVYFDSSISPACYRSSPQPASISALEVGMEKFYGVASQEAIPAVLGAELLPFVIARKNLPNGRLAYGAKFGKHGPIIMALPPGEQPLTCGTLLGGFQ